MRLNGLNENYSQNINYISPPYVPRKVGVMSLQLLCVWECRPFVLYNLILASGR